MDSRDAGRYWDENAKVWTRLTRAGCDTYCNHLNTPAFFEMLPDVGGRRGLDIGCGEGYNTRLLARRGALVTAIDVSETFIRHAQQAEHAEPLAIDYRVEDACALSFAEDSFDFAVAFMSLIDIPDPESALREAHRVIRSGGFFQFSISHPCFDTPHRINLPDDSGRTVAIEVGDYFENRDGEIIEWLFSAAPDPVKEGLRPFRVPRFSRTLDWWLTTLLDTGFRIEAVQEPRPSDAVVARCPNIQDAQIVAYFLHTRVRKDPL